MNWIQELLSDKNLHKNLFPFLDQYGILGLDQAITLYKKMHQSYICKTKESTSRINVYDIYYMEIHKHNITIYTEYGTFHKYGTLNNELKILSPYGFLKCAQNRIVSLNKIRTIQHNCIVLINDIQIYMSRSYAPHIIIAFSQNKAPKR